MKNTGLLFIMFILIAGCKKKYDGNDITTDDQGTFSVKVDGDYVSPCLQDATANGPVTTNFLPYNTDDFFLSLVFENKCDEGYFTMGKTVGIYFDSVQIHAGSTYPITNAGKGRVRCMYYTIAQYNSDASMPGSVTISTFDPVAKTIAGTFDCIVKKTDGTTVSLSEGQFDLKY